MSSRYFLTVTANNQLLGEIVIETRPDAAPRTSENFRILCTGERGVTYRGSRFDKAVAGSFVQGGSAPNGGSINGVTPNEKVFVLPHNAPGLVSMVSPGPGANFSQFTITTAPAPQLNGRQVVFGKVVVGYNIVQQIEKMIGGPPGSSKPTIVIVNCGRR